MLSLLNCFEPATFKTSTRCPLRFPVCLSMQKLSRFIRQPTYLLSYLNLIPHESIDVPVRTVLNEPCIRCLESRVCWHRLRGRLTRPAHSIPSAFGLLLKRPLWIIMEQVKRKSCSIYSASGEHVGRKLHWRVDDYFQIPPVLLNMFKAGAKPVFEL